MVYAVLLTIGLVIFHFGDSHKDVSTELLGWFFAFLSLFCDCFVAHFQKRLQSTTDLSYFTLLQATNFWCFIFSIIYSLVKNELNDGLVFLALHPSAFWDLMANAFTVSLMLYSVFYHLSIFGPVSMAKITVVRKCCTVFFSFLIFNHQLNHYKIFGLAVIFLLIVVEMIEEIKKESKNKKETKEKKEKSN